MSKMPWVRFFPSDWLGGTRGMSAVETGVYITLIATMYERCEPIVEDHARLARLCGASNSAFKKALETLIGEGKIIRVEAGLWNDRVEKEQVYLSEKSEVGSKAARARWDQKDNKNNISSDANALPTQSERNANQKPDTRDKSSSLRSEDSAPASSRKTGQADVEAFKAEVGTVLDGDRVEAICKVRRKKGATFSAHAGRLLVGALMACPNVAAAADEMILRNWTSVKPEWLQGSQRAQAPPVKPKSEFMQHQDDVQRILDQATGRSRHDQQFTGDTLDLGSGDYRAV